MTVRDRREFIQKAQLQITQGSLLAINEKSPHIQRMQGDKLYEYYIRLLETLDRCRVVDAAHADV